MRGIVIGGLGVDRPRELCARASPELPVDRNADLQALPIGQDRFPPGTVASAYAHADPHTSIPLSHLLRSARPIVAAKAFALAKAVDGFEAIDRSAGLEHWTTPRPSFRPAAHAPVHVEVSSGSECQSHIRHPDCGSSNHRPSLRGAVQLIPSESGSAMSHGLAR